MSQSHVTPDGGVPPSIPLWVKVMGAIITVLILLFVILHLTGHSPMNHRSHMLPGPQGGQQP